MIDTPPVLYVSSGYADKHQAELHHHIEDGGVVAILDLRRRRIREWRSQERPACIAAMPDDIERIWQVQHEHDSEVARQNPAWLPNLRKTPSHKIAARQRAAQEARNAS